MSGVTGPNIVTDNLILYVDAGNVQSYPGSGTTWYDLSGNNYHMVNGNTMPTYSSADGGKFTFNGSTQWVYATIPSLSINPFTYCVWVRSDLTKSAWASIIDQDNDDFLFATNNNILYLYDPTYSSGYTLTSNTAWHHFAISYISGSTSYFYVNGSSVSSFAVTLTHTSAHISIGAGYQNSELWDGDISMFQWYDTNLTAAEVLQNYNAHKSRFGL